MHIYLLFITYILLQSVQEGLTYYKEVSSDQELLRELRRQVEKEDAFIVLGFDDDEAGAKNTLEMAESLQKNGVNATRFGVVYWPAHDVNDWMKDGGSAIEARELLSEGAITWLDVLVEEAKHEPEQHRRVFDALIYLDTYEIEHRRVKISEALDLRKRTFDAMLKAARRDAGVTDNGRPRYSVLGGHMWRRYFNQYGEEQLQRLAHFEAWIEEDVLRDDGQAVEREIRCRGKVNGTVLPLAKVKASDFNKMNWVMQEWGSQAIIEAGSQTKEHLRTAMQLLSKKVKRQTVYTHTGWRKRGDNRYYRFY